MENEKTFSRKSFFCSGAGMKEKLLKEKPFWKKKLFWKPEIQESFFKTRFSQISEVFKGNSIVSARKARNFLKEKTVLKERNFSERKTFLKEKFFSASRQNWKLKNFFEIKFWKTVFFAILRSFWNLKKLYFRTPCTQSQRMGAPEGRGPPVARTRRGEEARRRRR